MSERRLQINPDPIKVVTGARRGEALGRTRFRCHYEDGRGRCSSRDTTYVWNSIERQTEAWCEKHRPDWVIKL